MFERLGKRMYMLPEYVPDCSPNVNAFLIWPTLPPSGVAEFETFFFFN